MQAINLGIFAFVYLGMLAGGIPGLALDRTGVALLGALALIATGAASPSEAARAIDVSTIALLFGLMIVSAQFRLGGFYTRFTRALANLGLGPAAFLAVVIFASGALSAVLSNDIVCLAMAPVLAESCSRRRLDPVPYLLALACSANVGSAATLIGNPQNMLIGQVLDLPFGAYLLQASVPTLLGLLSVWLIVCALTRGRWHRELTLAAAEAPAFDRWQTAKGAVVLAVVIGLFIGGEWQRDVVALTAAGVLLLSRRMASGAMLQLVDWQLLVLFAGLFVVNDAIARSGQLDMALTWLAARGVNLAEPAWLFGASVVLSNLVSNVPATMLLLPSAEHPLAGTLLALTSTFAGNLLVIGSIANIIVIDQAARLGLGIGWREHARIGVPVTAATLTLTAVWLGVLSGFD